MKLEIARLIAGIVEPEIDEETEEMEEYEDDEEQASNLKLYKEYGTGFGQKTTGVVARNEAEFMAALVEAAASNPEQKEELKDSLRCLRSNFLGRDRIYY